MLRFQRQGRVSLTCRLTLPATLLALLDKHVSMKLGQLIPGVREKVTVESSTEILPGACGATFSNVDIQINTLRPSLHQPH